MSLNRLIIYVISFAALLGSCKKEMEIDDNSSAVFFVKGVLDGESIEVKAGDDLYYMSPSVNEDFLGIRSFVGTLGSIGCIDEPVCPNSIQISIRELEVKSQGRLDINENISPENYDFRGPADYLFVSYKASFESKSMPSNLKHNWFFGDGIESNDVNPVHFYLNEEDSIVQPMLVVSNENGCQNSIRYETKFTSPCDVDFTPKLINGHLSWSPHPTKNRTELWDLTNGYLPFGVNNLPPNDSVFTACVQSSDDLTGCISYKCKNIILDSNKVKCVANFDVIKETVISEDIRDYSQVTISYTDELGKKYSSDRYLQPTESNFEITKVEDYLNDKNGNPTKKITLKFIVRLFGDSESDYKKFVTEKSVFAISYL